MAIGVLIGRWAAACFLLLSWWALGCGGDEGSGPVRAQVKERNQGRVVPGLRGHSLPYERRLDELLAHRRGQPFKLGSLRVIGRDKVHISDSVGFCIGSPQPPAIGSWPEIKRVSQVGTRKAVILTSFLVRPRFYVKPNPGEEVGCAGLESLASFTVSIRGGLRGRPIYDGSQSPPVKRWPRKKHG